MRQIIPLLASVITMIHIYLAGNKNIWAWKLSLINQIVWGIFIKMFHAWGLIPLTLAMTYLSIRNYLKWSKEEKELAIIETMAQ